MKKQTIANVAGAVVFVTAYKATKNVFNMIGGESGVVTSIGKVLLSGSIAAVSSAFVNKTVTSLIEAVDEVIGKLNDPVQETDEDEYFEEEPADEINWKDEAEE